MIQTEKRPVGRPQFAIVCQRRRFELPRIRRDGDLQAVVSLFGDALIGWRKNIKSSCPFTISSQNCVSHIETCVLCLCKPQLATLHLPSRGHISRRCGPNLPPGALHEQRVRTTSANISWTQELALHNLSHCGNRLQFLLIQGDNGPGNATILPVTAAGQFDLDLLPAAHQKALDNPFAQVLEGFKLTGLPTLERRIVDPIEVYLLEVLALEDWAKTKFLDQCVGGSRNHYTSLI
jgi:hypothetical protein